MTECIQGGVTQNLNISHWFCTYPLGDPGCKWGLNPSLNPLVDSPLCIPSL